MAIPGDLDQLTGRVIDENGNALSFVTVSFPQLKVSTQSNIKGEFVIALEGRSEGELLFFKHGFKSLEIDLNELNEANIEVVLYPFQANLNAVEVSAQSGFYENRLRDVEGVAVYSGKKNDIVKLKSISANLATANARQIYAKVSGLNIWESDANGNQLEIGGRGLNPSRSSNFNVRQNGYDISADALGYPESYYSPAPLAIDKIEIVRGASSLQYGSQFGGLVNFKLLADPTQKIEGELNQSFGSFGLSNTFLKIASKQERLSAKAYVQRKTGDGFTEKSSHESTHAFANVNYQLNPNLKIGAELTYYSSLAEQPGGLTDKQFEEDALQVTRFGNWFAVDWFLPSLNLAYQKGNYKSEITYSYLDAQRSALGFIQSPDRVDPIKISSASYAESQRDLFLDEFNNHTVEWRNVYRYSISEKPAALAFGARIYKGNSRKLQAAATPGDKPVFESDNTDANAVQLDYDFDNYNTAVYVENVLPLGSFKFSPGIRAEWIQTDYKGYSVSTVRDQSGNVLSADKLEEESVRPRAFVIAALGVSRKQNNTEFYSNISQNYRSVSFSDFKVRNPSYRVDQNLKDERGFNFDLGLRRVKKKLKLDANVFFLRYNNRIGFTSIIDENTFRVYQYRTNVGASHTYGVESLVEYAFVNSEKWYVSAMVNTSFQKGKYVSSRNSNIVGNKVELIPDLTLKSGLDVKYKNIGFSVLYTYVDDHFSDATNAFETAGGISGLIPSYQVLDFTLCYRYKKWKSSVGVNNALNNIYFTRRATGYPGPGIITAQPRNFFASLQYSF